MIKGIVTSLIFKVEPTFDMAKSSMDDQNITDCFISVDTYVYSYNGPESYS